MTVHNGRKKLGIKSVQVKTLLLSVFLIMFLSKPAISGELYAFIVSKNLQQTQDIIDSFKESFPIAETAVLDLQGQADTALIQKFIADARPSAIICMGALAAKSTTSIEKKIPILFSMVINYKSYPELQQDNVVGVAMEIPMQTILTQFKWVAPNISRIGVPYYSSGLIELIHEAETVGKTLGTEIVGIKVEDVSKVKNTLQKQAEQCSALWMIGDTQLYNKQTEAITDLVDFSRRKKIPLFAFSEAFLKPGAFFSISIDYRSMGSQLALLSRQIVEDKTPLSQISVAPPIGTFTVINRDVADALYGKSLDESIFDEVDKSYPEEVEK